MRSRAHWHGEGGGQELLRLALPLILSNSFWTIQITVDRIVLSRYNPDAVGAAMLAVLLFWTPFILLQNTANYATTFVAQYLGAGRVHRIGPSVWQALHFSVISGIAFLGMWWLAEPLVAIGQHTPAVQELEVIYFRCLTFAALPMLITAAASSFFAGRGDSWTVLWINAAGTAVNAVLDVLWVFGYWGFPEWGIAGAGWATVIGSWVSAVLAIGLMLRRRFRTEFQTWSGRRLEPALFGRLLRFGVPNGVQWMIDGLAFTVFLMLVGQLGPAELSATTIAFTINMIAFLPMFGIGQAVSILVGQRLGQDRPEIAERSTWVGFTITWFYMATVAVLYVLVPQVFLMLFKSEADVVKWAAVAALVPVLLRFVAVYSLFDSMNLIFSFGLRGAGDTHFVTLVSLILAWPIMVVPTWLALEHDWGLYWCWGFASAYVIALAFTFLFRFRTGKWKSMRVIEPLPPEEALLAMTNGEAPVTRECLMTEAE